MYEDTPILCLENLHNRFEEEKVFVCLLVCFKDHSVILSSCST